MSDTAEEPEDDSTKEPTPEETDEESDWDENFEEEDTYYPELSSGWDKLVLFDDLFLRSQGNNIGIVDGVLRSLEEQVVQQLIEEERTPVLTLTLNALTQMWCFSVYELLRTWKQRCKDFQKWHTNKAIDGKLQTWATNPPSNHAAKTRIKQLEAFRDDSKLRTLFDQQVNHLEPYLERLDLLRIGLAKHEVSGHPNLMATMPGYARISIPDQSLSYGVEYKDGDQIYSTSVTRRDVASDIGGFLRSVPQ